MSYTPGSGSSFVGTAPTYVASAQAASTSTCAMPAGIADDDMVLVALSKDSAGGSFPGTPRDHLISVTTPGWWGVGTNGGYPCALDVFAKKVAASEASLIMSDNDASQCVVASSAFRGVGVVVPLCVAYNNSGTVTLPAFTVPFANSLVVAVGACASAGGGLSSVPSGWTQHVSANRWYPSLWMASKVFAAGAVSSGLQFACVNYAKDYSSVHLFALTPALA